LFSDGIAIWPGPIRQIAIFLAAAFKLWGLFMVKLLFRRLSALLDERGATMTEYAIVVGLIAIVAIGAVTVFQGSLSAAFTNLANQLNSHSPL
jgi:Flp pilus assembly pilin Flp